MYDKAHIVKNVVAAFRIAYFNTLKKDGLFIGRFGNTLTFARSPQYELTTYSLGTLKPHNLHPYLQSNDLLFSRYAEDITNFKTKMEIGLSENELFVIINSPH